MSTTLLIVGISLGAVILVAALKAALGPDNKKHDQSDGGGVFIGDGSSRNKNDDNDSDGDSGGDGGGD